MLLPLRRIRHDGQSSDHVVASPSIPGLAIALLLASAATWARFLAEGSLRLVPNTPASWAANAVVGLALLWVGVAALRWLARAEKSAPSQIARAGLLLQLAALPALALTSNDVF